MANPETQNSISAPGIALGARIEIFPSLPLPDLNATGGMAFAARYKSDASSTLYAIVCLSGLPPRFESINAMRSIDNPGVVRLIEGGVINWTDGSNVYALVYQKPTAPRMSNSFEEARPPVSEDSINHHFISPMVNALNALMRAGVTHDAIRPSNIFWRIGTAASPQIGECLSAPAGIGQPVLFESIERALATPLGRGVGIHADDCYSFGMTLACLVMGQNPMQGLDDHAIIEAKMQRGSFGAVVGSHRLSAAHIEVLRGLLADDPAQRWSALELDQWLGGRRMTPKSSDLGKRAARHFDFIGKKFWQAGPLATALTANVTEATKVIENDALNKWLQRALNDPERAKDIQSVIDDLKQRGRSSNYEDQLVTRVSIALDPSAPIRYRGISALPMGIPPLLVEATLNGNNIQTLSEIISSQLVSVWIERQQESRPEYIPTSQLFERLRGNLEKASFGSGVERALYEANPAIPCLSPMLRAQYVMSAKTLLPALERVAGSGNRPRDPMDRHIAAFLIVREKRGESLFAAMTAPEGSVKRGLALLSLFAELQNRHGPEHLPNLAAWIAPAIESALRRFLSRTLREKVQKQARDIIAAGNLSQLLRLIDDPRRVEHDQQDFYAARLLHLNIQKEILGLEAKINNRENVVKESGKPMAASISSFLAIILICAAIIRALFSALFL